jgi:hypothetical protein
MIEFPFADVVGVSSDMMLAVQDYTVPSDFDPPADAAVLAVLAVLAVVVGVPFADAVEVSPDMMLAV